MAVYFFHRDRDGLVKIGYSRNPVERTRAISVEHGGGEVLATIPGGALRERWLHRLLRNDRVTGEWFRTSVALKKIVDEAVETGDVSSLPSEDITITLNQYDHLRWSLGVTVRELAAMQNICHGAMSSSSADSLNKRVAYLDLLAIQSHRAMLNAPRFAPRAIGPGRTVTVSSPPPPRPGPCS